MDFKVLGPIAVIRDGAEVPVTKGRQTELLARLLIDADRLLTTDELIESLYPDKKSDIKKSISALRFQISKLKSTLDPDGTDGLIVSKQGGYMIALDGHSLDSRRLDELLEQGAGLVGRNASDAAAVLSDALDLFEGDPYLSVAYTEFARVEIRRIEELRDRAMAERIDAQLALGRSAEVLTDLERLVETHPFDEKYTMQLMTALYRENRQQDAQRAFDQTEKRLREELGMTASQDMRDLFQQIIDQRLPKPMGRFPLPASIAQDSPLDLDDEDFFIPSVMIGRAPQLERLMARLDNAMEGRLQYAVIEGEAGIGKSRLARELARNAYGLGCLVLHGRVEPDLQPTFGPFAEIIRYVLRASKPGERPFGGSASELARITPELRTAYPELDAPVEADAATERFRLLEALVEWLSLMSADRPVVIVIDDLHRATDTTLDAIRYIASYPIPMSVMIVGTARTGEIGKTKTDAYRKHATAMGRTRSFVIEELTGLDEPGTDEFVSEVAGSKIDPRTRDLLTWLHEYTQGNPFFIGSILRHLVTTGMLYRNEDGAWTTAGTLEQLAVPESVQDTILERVAALDDDDRSTLILAALIGQRFDTSVLVKASDRSSTEVGRLMEALVRSRMLHSVEGEPTKRRFSHDLLREAILSGRDPLSNAPLHGRIGEALESTEDVDGRRPYDQLSFQFMRSVQPESTEVESDHMDKALMYSRKGAVSARNDLQYAREAMFYRRMLDVYVSRGVSLSRVAECELLIKQGRALRRAARRSAFDVLVHACMLAEGAKDRAEIDAALVNSDYSPDVRIEVREPQLLAEAALSNTRGSFSVVGAEQSDIRSQWLERALTASDSLDDGQVAVLNARIAMERIYLDVTQEEDLLARSEASLRLAESANVNNDDLLRIMNDHLQMIWRPDHLDDRDDVVARMYRLAKAVDQPHWRWASASYAFQAAIERGSMRRADEMLGQMVDLAEVLKQPRLVQWTKLRQSVRAAINGDLALSETLALDGWKRAKAAGNPDADLFLLGQLWTINYHRDSLPSIADRFERQFELVPWLPVVAAALCASSAESGDTEETQRWLNNRSPLTFLRVDQDQLAAMAALCIGTAAVNDEALGVDLYDALIPFRSQYIDNGTSYHGSVAHYLGLVSSVLGRTDEAVEHFAFAREQHEAIESSAFVGHTLVAWSEALVSKDAPAAIDLASEAEDLALSNPQLVRVANRSGALLARLSR